MIMRCIVLLLTLAVLGACAPTITHDCKNPGYVPINIKYKKSEISISPHARTADEGDALRFKLDGDVGVLVSVLAKDVEDQVWLKGSGKSSFFIVCVPDDVVPEDKEEEEFGYDVTVDDIGSIDPVVIIRRF